MWKNVSTWSKWPKEGTIEELTIVARKRLGKRFLSVKIYQYSEAVQVEIRSRGMHYDGQTFFKREACYQQ
jgi:hypothetical protein